MATDLEMDFRLSGKPPRVMELLTNPTLIRKWSGGEAVVELQPGGKFEMFDGWVTGSIVEAAPLELAYTWKITEWGDAPESEVRFKLRADSQGGTIVHLTHKGFPDEEEMRKHKAGWNEYFFDPMEDFMIIIDKS